MVEKDKCIKLETFNHVYFLKAKESMVMQNKRIRKYLETNNELLLIEALEGDTHTLDKVATELEVKDLQSLPYDVVTREEKAKIQRDKTEFCIHVLDGYRHKYTTLSDNNQKWLYVPITDKGWDISVDIDGQEQTFDLQNIKNLTYYVEKTYNMKICGLAERARKMVEKDNNFILLNSWLDTWKPSKKEVNYLKQMSAKNRNVVDGLRRAEGIKDTNLIDIMKEYDIMDKTTSVEVPFILKKKVELEKEFKDFLVKDEKVFSLIDNRYPLLRDLFDAYSSSKQVKEVVSYLNAKFKGK
jgi:hypothetical protein